ncbi:hypothetical protein [Saccharopolyspora shandongensis]|uniref:hypothetical protein n=1 Tax=Saccharopolyspora shandongensis TaxID=418495 RepID=UPI0033EEAF01
MASKTDDGTWSPEDGSLGSLPPEMRVYVPPEDAPVEPPEPEAGPEPAYERVSLASLSGAARPQQETTEDGPRKPAKGVGLPSKFSLIALAGAAVILVSVPFVVAMMVSRDDDLSKEPALIDVETAVPGAIGEPVPALPPGKMESVPDKPAKDPVRSNTPTTVTTRPSQTTSNGTAPVGTGTIIAGAGCPNTASTQYQAVGFYSNGTEGWYTRSGGSTDGGCRGTFDAMPMSGDNKPDSGAYGKWTFDVSDKMLVGNCSLSVYIPNDSDPRDVGATAAHYSLFNSFDQGGANSVGVANINQVANRGRWTALGNVKIDQGKLSVKLQNRGVDDAEGDGVGAHIAVSQIRVTCTPA